MKPDPRTQTHCIGLAMIGLMCLGFGAVANIAAGRAFPASPVTLVIADVLAAAFIGFALCCLVCALRGHVARWYSDLF